MSERFADAPISRLVGFRVLPASDDAEQLGEATVEIDCGPHHHNPMGRVHGGLISALADAAMGIAFGRTLLESEDFSTIEMKVSFIRPIRVGTLSAKAVVIQRGLRIGFVECKIVDHRGKLVATASSTCTVLSS
ncbi:PaaI family thioesterase [Rhodopirellula sallentina]|uniref:Phenylacetic acid degradation-related protein domain protein n=1 Tax=Rhodopirellula sallentina SM41 TaxID=1263870 RepID=M5TSC3_9BACT|nr:PaaI family thioesterase [Rhodopirellula sallentina]EMI52060.1 Phenylacetic acid degradation-related protein domain protein [Rhodopirellula sallentina SM41]